MIGTAMQRAAEYVSSHTLQLLIRDWRGYNCVALRDIAKTLLGIRGKLRVLIFKLLEPMFDRLENWLATSTTLQRLFDLPVLRVVNRKLAAPLLANMAAQQVSRIFSDHLPGMDHLAATARAMQVLGIISCAAQDRDMTTCACLKAIVEADGEEVLDKVIMAGADDWIKLAGLPVTGS